MPRRQLSRYQSCFNPASLSLKMSGLELWALPDSFREGGDSSNGTAIAFRRYPLFWRVFLWGFGGFCRGYTEQVRL